jgi:WD40 repeat protein
VDGVAFSPDSKRLATTSHGDEMVKLWDVETRQDLLTLAGTGSEIYAVEFTDDGNTILVGRRPFAARSLSGLCQFWTVPSWAEILAAERSDAVARRSK